MKEVKVGDKVFVVPKKYTDKRRVEREIRIARNKLAGFKANKINKRKEELQIPIAIDKKTTIFVRESKILNKKWVNILGSIERVKKYVKAYKLSLL